MRKYYIALLFGILLAVIVSILLVLKTENYLYDAEIIKINQSHELIEENIHDFERDKDLFIHMISEYTAVKELLHNKEEPSLASAQIFIYNLVKGSKNIMQLRVLDNSGREQVRVNRLPTNELVQVDDEGLQDKSDRDYFIEFSKLKKNDIGFSSLDLNIEHGKLEVPWRPTLRIGIPVFIGSKRVGLVIVNYNMEHILEHLSKISRTNFYLIDSQDYFIIHPDDKWKWSKYQFPSKKMDQYFTEFKNKKIDLDTMQIAKNLFAKKIELFNNEEMIAIYEPKVPVDSLLFEKGIELIIAIFIILMLILIPVAKLILVFIKNLHEERDRLKYSETYISNIFNNTFDAMFIIDRAGSIKKVNSAAEKLFNYKESELLDNNIKMLVPEPDHSKHDGYLKDYKDDGHSTIIGEERELYALDKLGNLIPISLSVTKMEMDGEMFFIGSIKDYTQVKVAQIKQREQEMMLLQQSKFAAMGEMLSAIAHQWRQPLNSIGLIIQDLVSAEKYGEFTTAYLLKSRDSIMDQLRLMSDTIDEFRNFFSKVNVKERFSVINAVEEVRHLYWAQFNTNDITLELLCQNEDTSFTACKIESQDYMLESLPSELKQVLLNLIANAKDAIEQIENPSVYERKISVYLRQTEKTILIEICDNAGGINDESIQRIFEPYFTTKEMGTGLGLFIIKTLLEKHLYGTIMCQNKESEFDGKSYKGCCFTITLPKSIDFVI